MRYFDFGIEQFKMMPALDLTLVDDVALKNIP
jgi:hypothetical protein